MLSPSPQDYHSTHSSSSVHEASSTTNVLSRRVDEFCCLGQLSFFLVTPFLTIRLPERAVTVLAAAAAWWVNMQGRFSLSTAPALGPVTLASDLKKGELDVGVVWNRKGRLSVTSSKMVNLTCNCTPSQVLQLPAICQMFPYLTWFCKFFVLQLWREKFPLQTTTVSNFQASVNAPSLRFFALHLPELVLIQAGPCNLS